MSFGFVFIIVLSTLIYYQVQVKSTWKTPELNLIILYI